MSALLAEYLIAINLVTAAVFLFDKLSAERHGWRVAEWVLHALELAGGCLVVLPLLFVVHHKSKKWSYYLFTVAFFAVWAFILYRYL